MRAKELTKNISLFWNIDQSYCGFSQWRTIFVIDKQEFKNIILVIIQF